jgi:hypothetical protein
LSKKVIREHVLPSFLIQILFPEENATSYLFSLFRTISLTGRRFDIILYSILQLTISAVLHLYQETSAPALLLRNVEDKSSINDDHIDQEGEGSREIEESIAMIGRNRSPCHDRRP